MYFSPRNRNALFSMPEIRGITPVVLRISARKPLKQIYRTKKRTKSDFKAFSSCNTALVKRKKTRFFEEFVYEKF